MVEHMTVLSSRCLAQAGAVECRGRGACASSRSEAGGVEQRSAQAGRDSDERVGVFRREFDRSPSLAREFRTAEAYVAFRRAEARGLVQIFRPELATVLGATH